MDTQPTIWLSLTGLPSSHLGGKESTIKSLGRLVQCHIHFPPRNPAGCQNATDHFSGDVFLEAHISSGLKHQDDWMATTPLSKTDEVALIPGIIEVINALKAPSTVIARLTYISETGVDKRFRPSSLTGNRQRNGRKTLA